jgi:dihydrofolate synthase/folylpolyglutamate synthase
MDVALLAERVKGLHGSVSATESVEQAVVRARQLASEDDLVVITGSLYVVGDARAAILGSADRTSGLAGLKG